MLKTRSTLDCHEVEAYHLGEGRVLKTKKREVFFYGGAYHLGEGRVLKTSPERGQHWMVAYHLGEGRVLKTLS